MKKLDEQLNELPSEFLDEMEYQKAQRWEDVFIYLTKEFNCLDDIVKMHNDNLPIIQFLRSFYDMGYYSGINFALDPQEKYKEEKQDEDEWEQQ